MQNPQSVGQARIMYELGRHLTSDFASYFRFSVASENGRVGVERHEFTHACEQLREAGYILRDEEIAWEDFARLRVQYGAHLNELARWLEIPPIQWVGDRSLIERQKAHLP